MKKAIPDQIENPNGLHQRYYIQKVVKNPDAGVKVTDTFMGLDNTPDFILKPVDPKAEYFVLRLDSAGDLEHVTACRLAIITYAEAIQHYLPELSKDLIERYSDKQSKV